MQRILRLFSPASRPATPEPLHASHRIDSGAQAIRWSPYVNLRGSMSPGAAAPEPRTPLLGRTARRLFADDACDASRRCSRAGAVSDHKHLPPSLPPVRQAHPPSPLLPTVGTLESDLRQVLESLDRLPLADLAARAESVALRQMGRAGPQGVMQQLIDGLVRPSGQRLGPDALGTLVFGLARACDRLTDGIDPHPEAAAAMRCLSDYVQGTRRSLDLQRYTAMACGVSRAQALNEPPRPPPPPLAGGAQSDSPATPGRSPTRKAASSPQALSRLMARDPAMVLQARDIPMTQRLELLDLALRLPGALPTRIDVETLCERILAVADKQARAAALMILIQHRRPHLAPGALRIATLGNDTVESMVRCELLGAAWDCADAFQRAVDQVEAGVREELGETLAPPSFPAVETKSVPLRGHDAERVWLDGPQPETRARWDVTLQRRHEQALSRAAQRVVALYSLFDSGRFAAAALTPGQAAPPMDMAQWCFAIEQASWLRDHALHGSPKAQGVEIWPDWLAREARQGGTYLGRVAMEVSRRLVALVPDRPSA